MASDVFGNAEGDGVHGCGHHREARGHHCSLVLCLVGLQLQLLELVIVVCREAQVEEEAGSTQECGLGSNDYNYYISLEPRKNKAT